MKLQPIKQLGMELTLLEHKGVRMTLWENDGVVQWLKDNYKIVYGSVPLNEKMEHIYDKLGVLYEK